MNPTAKEKGPAKNVSRSAIKAMAPAKRGNVSTKKPSIRDEIIRPPLRKTESDAAVLLFDEADALFGKRTAVRDSHDRYANLTSDLLVQNPEKRASKTALNKRKAKKKNVP